MQIGFKVPEPKPVLQKLPEKYKKDLEHWARKCKLSPEEKELIEKLVLQTGVPPERVIATIALNTTNVSSYEFSYAEREEFKKKKIKWALRISTIWNYEGGLKEAIEDRNYERMKRYRNIITILEAVYGKDELIDRIKRRSGFFKEEERWY